MKDGLYSQICNDVSHVIEQLTVNQETAIIYPSAIARDVFNSWNESPKPKAEWCEVEQLKQIARSLLRQKHGHGSKENEIYQEDMFSGHLQSFYPTPPDQDSESAYKRVELLTDDEIIFNENMLRKQGRARLQHADALAAYRKSRAA
jgi:hypothetical protein